MAKKTQRVFVYLACSECKRENYITQKNKMNTPDKMSLKKYCPWCKKSTSHKEIKKKK